MNAPTHTTDEAHALLADVTEALTETVKEAALMERKLQGQVTALSTEVNTLKAAKQQQEVVLQKVAFDKSEVDAVLDKMIGQHLLHPDHREKMASALLNNTKFALSLLDRVVTVHEPPMPPIGAGIKRAETNTPPKDKTANPPKAGFVTDDDGWMDWFSQVNKRGES